MRVEQVNNTPRLTLADYQKRASAVNKLAGSLDAGTHLRFGLFGEIGGLLSAVKKAQRDLTPADHHSLTEELGDSLWYLTTVTASFDLDLQSIGALAIQELQRRFNVQREIPAIENLSFEVIDGLLTFCSESVDALELSKELSRLGAHAGQLVHLGQRDLADQVPEALLANIFADIAIAAGLFRQSLLGVARANLQKIESRWPSDGASYIPLFDEHMPVLEKFPRRFEMHFIERHNDRGTAYVVQQLNGVNIGDRLTDNRLEPDGYRFHDVFHLAYLVHLGWSPVIRALLKLKRKSDATLDENEDGARAMIIEEGIATWIFNHAIGHKMFVDGTPGRLEYRMLKQVRDMISGYEVAKCPLWQWERAILDGFRVFRELFDNGGGIATVDLNDRTLTFRPGPKEEVSSIALPPKRPLMVGAVLPPQDFTSQ